MTPVIRHLFEKPELTGTVAGWIYREFWQGRGGYDLATLEKLLGDAVDPDLIPLSLLAEKDGVPVGTVNLIGHDHSKRPELTPWLAALFVVREFRGMGIGSALVERLLSEAGRLGVERLYLGADNPGFYTRLGAVPHEIVDGLAIMRFELPQHHRTAAGMRRIRTAVESGGASR